MTGYRNSRRPWGRPRLAIDVICHGTCCPTQVHLRARRSGEIWCWRSGATRMEFSAAVEGSVGIAWAAHSLMSSVTTCGAPHMPAHQKRFLPCGELDHDRMLSAQMPGTLSRRPDPRCKVAPSYPATNAGMPRHPVQRNLHYVLTCPRAACPVKSRTAATWAHN